MKLNISDYVFIILLCAKILHIGTTNYSIWGLTLIWISFGLLGHFFNWLFSEETKKKIATKMYLQKNKRELDKIVEDARESK